MAEVRVVPSGKVYRQMFDAQVQMSRALCDSRKKGVAKHEFPHSISHTIVRQRGTGILGLSSRTGANHFLDDMCALGQLSSGTKPSQRSEQEIVIEEIKGLPDNVVVENLGSDIIAHLLERKQNQHIQAVAQLHKELSMLRVENESFLRKTGKDFLLNLSECDENVERLMQRLDNASDLENFSLQDLFGLWDSVNQGSVERRKRIRELDAGLEQYECERTVQITFILRKYTGILEKICYVTPCDIHRIMNGEAMMMNQAILGNRRAAAKLFVNLIENDLQKELSHRLCWQDKLQDWKRIKVQAWVTRFRKFMSSPHIQCPTEVQAMLDSMRTAQASLSEKRIKFLQSISSLAPPKCSTLLATEWHSTLSNVNEQIDCLHIDSMIKLRLYYEKIWQDSLGEVERFKMEAVTYGLSSEEIQHFIDSDFLPLIGQCQSLSEERLEAMDAAFEMLAKRASVLSEQVFKFARGAAHLWEVHIKGLQWKKQQLLDQLEEIRHAHRNENQKKEAQLDVLTDRLRQEGSEESLRVTLDKTLHFLEEIKNGYFSFYKDELDKVESYPALVLEEMHCYSMAISRFFGVMEIYNLDSEELCSYFPWINVVPETSERAREKGKRQIKGQGWKHNIISSQKAGSPARTDEKTHLSVDSLFIEDDTSSHPWLSDSQMKETFTTSKGNVYHALGAQVLEEAEQSPLPEVELVLYPISLLTELLQEVRLAYFNHLEERYQTVLASTVNIVVAKKEELKSELDLRLHLHEPRAKRIEMDIHNVRAAELVLHHSRVDRHCKGILQALKKAHTDLHDLQIQQQKQTENFQAHISSMEDVFTFATKSDVLVTLRGMLQSSLEKHMNHIQVSQRNIRQKMELKLESLREANFQLVKSFKLFSEGGNFTPKEIDPHQRCLEKMAKRIDSTDEAIMIEMEGIESKCLEKAKDMINKFEDKLNFWTVDLKFLEKIQRMLTNTQVQIKAEATKNNMQKKKLTNMLTELEKMIDACARPSPDKMTVRPDDLFSLTWKITDKLKKRCQYLDCGVDPSLATRVPDSPLQGPFAVASRPKSRRQCMMSSPAVDILLQPSHMGVPFIDDLAVSVVRGLLRIGKPVVTQEVCVDNLDRSSTAGPAGQRERTDGTPCQPALNRWQESAESVSCQSVKRLSKATRFDKRFQVFGSKPGEQGLSTFKGFITSILWKANDFLLLVAEDFYKKKDCRSLTRPQYLRETFEQCAEDVNRRLEVYQSQAHEYHSGCLQEFRQQLMQFEESLLQVPVLLISHLGQQHLEALSQDTNRILQHLELITQDSENSKKEHIKKLRVRFGHPACENELESLLLAEEKRQKEYISAIQSTKLELQVCVRKQGDRFVTALASLTENLLFQMDNLLTIDEVQVGEAAMKRETLTALFRQKQAGVLLDDKQRSPQIQRDGRTWPGLCYLVPAATAAVEQPSLETASITTAKTTLPHLKTMETRDATYQHYRLRYEEELSLTNEKISAKERDHQSWEEHWRHSTKTLTQLFFV